MKTIFHWKWAAQNEPSSTKNLVEEGRGQHQRKDKHTNQSRGDNNPEKKLQKKRVKNRQRIQGVVLQSVQAIGETVRGIKGEFNKELSRVKICETVNE